MKLQATIPITIGDTICIKSHLDAVKDRFEEIRLGFNKSDLSTKGPGYEQFLDEMGALFFSKVPYVYEPNSKAMFRAQFHILSDNGFKAQIPNQQEFLCLGDSLDINEYVVFSTKIRYLDRQTFQNIAPSFFQTLRNISCPIAIMGEREVEMHQEYVHQSNEIYGIYPEIQQNLPKFIDLTVPKLGITTPSLNKIQQDCLVMNQAKAVITLGIGGNFCMALGSGAKVIGFRNDNEPIASALFDAGQYPTITKDFECFIKLISHL